jgi:hypothetical protein
VRFLYGCVLKQQKTEDMIEDEVTRVRWREERGYRSLNRLGRECTALC